MSGNVRRCARKLLIGVVCLLLLDVLLGGFTRFVFFQQRSGKFFRIQYAMAQADARVFVFGSSHAAFHYVPDVLSEELGVPCYNAGVLGQQILFHRTLESIVLERMTPDTIILDVDPSTLYQTTAAYDRLSDLRPFYFEHPDIIGPVLSRRSPLERLFLLSKLYQYNSTLVHVLRYALSPQPDSNGYRPAHGVMRVPTAEEERAEIEARRDARAGALDPVMIDAIERFADDAMRRNVAVLYFVSPGALPDDLETNASFVHVRAIARRRGIPLFEFRNHIDFLGRYSLFYDSGHLNDNGARLYSKLVADTIRRWQAGRAPQDRRAVRATTPGRAPRDDARVAR